jgi:DNA-binding CsgD family transcriptional regulator
MRSSYERELWPMSSERTLDRSLTDASNSPHAARVARLTGVVSTITDAPIAPRHEPSIIRGQCRITPAAGSPIVVEVTGKVDWSTGTIQLSGLTHHPLAEAAGDVLVAHPALTPREMEVARLLARGESNARVAELLAISPHTARRHTENVMFKLGARSRAQVGAILRGA